MKMILSEHHPRLAGGSPRAVAELRNSRDPHGLDCDEDTQQTVAEKFTRKSGQCKNCSSNSRLHLKMDPLKICLLLLAVSIQLTASQVAIDEELPIESNNRQPTGLHASDSMDLEQLDFVGGRQLNLAPNQRQAHGRSQPNRPQADELFLSSASGQQGNHIRDEASTQTSGPSASPSSKLHIVRVLAPDAIQNGTQNVTIDCMFKFDKKLDQRLTIKWFFNDELEPIYQWIPELNKRVFSDRYEQYLDKGYEVGQDVDFMLQAYRWLQLSSSQPGDFPAPPPPSILDTSGNSYDEPTREEEEEDYLSERDLQAGRRQLANRLNKLAKLGGKHSKQLLDSLRQTLEMDPKWPEFTRFRALRLIRPTTQLNGRFTCSVSSLEGDDLKSKQLVVYEPAKSFTFTVNRVPNSPNQFNLSCQASQVFPRPSLTLVRYRAGPPNQAAALSISEQPQQPQRRQQQAGRPARQQQQHQSGRPKLAAASLRQEPIADTRTHLTLSYVRAGQRERVETLDGDTPTMANDINAINGDEQQQQRPEPGPSFYDISSWALVDEASLSSYVVTQFECLLSIDGLDQLPREPQLPANLQQQQRLSLALQKGWHVNSAALTSRSTLLGLFSALASLLCLMLAMVSSMLIFKLLKRHAKNRIHDQDKTSDCTTDEATVAGPSSSSRQLNR